MEGQDDWEELEEWKFLTACCSPSVEQLHERFVRMEMQGVALMKLLVLGAGLGTSQVSATPSQPQEGLGSMGQGAVVAFPQVAAG